jgi:CRISPR-associated protein Csb1
MPETLTPSGVLEKQGPLVLFAFFEPVARLDRFQPAGFPEVGHVIYKAPRADGKVENVSIVTAPPHGESFGGALHRGAHDTNSSRSSGMPYFGA